MGDVRAEGLSAIRGSKLISDSRLTLTELTFASLKIRNLKGRMSGTYCIGFAQEIRTSIIERIE